MTRFSPVPQYVFGNITDITPDFLELHEIRFLMLDMDNTIAAYGTHAPSAEVLQWAERMRSCGIELFIVTNSKRTERVVNFAKALGTGFVRNASKPSPSGILRALDQSEHFAGESAFAGDQVYTDVIAANRAGVLSIAVRPLSRENPLLAIRYALEAPFRAICKYNMARSTGFRSTSAV